MREIRTFRPDAVLAVDPETLFHDDEGVNHIDHRAAGIAAVDAVYPAARNGMAFPWLARDGLEPHTVRRLYLFWSGRPTAWIDVSGTIDRKLEALRAHPSQMRHPEELEPRIREWASEEGAAIGVEAAEALRVIVIEADRRPTPRPRTEAPPADRPTRRSPGLTSLSRARGAPGRTRPQLFQTSARSPARGPSASTISPSVRSPACSTSHSSDATVACSYSSASSRSRGQLRIRIRSRPA